MGNLLSRSLHFEKSQKNDLFFWKFFRIHGSFPRILILIMVSDPSRRGSNFRRFLDVWRRKNNDILGIFLVGKNCVFSAGPKLLLRTIQKKNVFFLESSGIYFFIIFLLRGYVFLLCFLGCPRLPEDCAKKRKKWRFFGWERTVLFWLQRKAAGFVPWSYVKTFDKNPKTIFM